MIIGLTGKKQSGKDTAAAYLVNNYGFERRAYADPLKKSVAALFNLSLEQIDYYKQDEYVTININFVSERAATTLTFREFLQRYGTESHRDVFGYDFWLDHTLPVGGFYAGAKIVITDCRFQNEVDRVNYLGGLIVRIDRPNTDEEDIHISENVDAVYYPKGYCTINNDGTIEDLHRKFDELLASVKVDE